MERTEEQKVCQAPIKVMLGAQEYAIKPLVIRDARAWRGKLVEVLSRIPQHLSVTTDTPERFSEAMTVLLVRNPDEVADLFFSYARDLPRADIEATATDAELAAAWEQLAEVAFPLAGSLMRILAPSRAPSTSP